MTTFLKNNIKEEIPDDDNNVDDQELDGTIVDYQFLVRPKQEQIDTKPNPVALELVGEIVDIPENHSKLNKSDEANIEPMYWELDEEGEYCEQIIRKKEPPNFFCEYCDCKFRKKFTLKRHNMMVHQGLKLAPIKKTVLFCKYCDYKTYTMRCLKIHTNIHENKFRYKCRLCDYKVNDKRSVESHIKVHHTQSVITFICNICGFGSTNKKSHEMHSTLHTGKERKYNRKYNCDLCSYRARYPSELNVHKDSVHLNKPKKKPIVCDMCGKTFTLRWYLNIHLFKVHGKDVGIRKYICYTCGYKDVQKEQFTHHVLKHLNQNSKYKEEKMYCANCDYSTFSRTNLTQHMVKHNKHVKMHKCNVCSFETKRPHTLRHHIKTHLDKK